MADGLNLATLGIRIDNSDVEAATTSMRTMTSAGSKLEQGVINLADATERYDRQFRSIADAQKEAIQINNAMTASTKMIATAQADAIRMDEARDASIRRLGLAQVQAIALDEKLAASAAAASAASASFEIQGLGRIRQGLTSLVASLTGTIPVVDRMGSTLLASGGIGSGVIIAVLAGIAALAFAYDKLTASSREAQKQQEAAIKVAEEHSRKKALGVGGEIGAGTDAEVQKAADDLIKIAALQAKLDAHPSYSRTKVNEIKAEIQDLRSNWSDIVTVIQDGTAEVARITAEAFDREKSQMASSLSERLRANQNDHAARATAIDELKADRALLAQYMALPMTPENNARVAQYAQLVKELADALKVLDPFKKLWESLQSFNDDAVRNAIKSINDEADARAKAQASYEGAIASTMVEVDALNRENAARAQGKQALEDVQVALAGEAAAREFAGKVTMTQLAALILLRQEQERQKILGADAQKTDTAENGRIKKLLNQAQSDLTQFFDTAFTKGIASFGDLFSHIKDMFLKLLADMTAANIMPKLATVIPGAAVAVAGPTPGGGATAAASLNPWLIGAAAVVGVGAALWGLASAAKEAAARAEELQHQIALQFGQSLIDMQRLVFPGTNLQQQLDQATDYFNKQRDIANQDTNDADRANALKDIAYYEALRIQQLKDEDAAMQKSMQSDYMVRLLTATGQDQAAADMAFALQQQREYAQAIKDGADATTLAALATTQHAEALKRQSDAIAAQMATLQSSIAATRATAQSLRDYGGSLGLSTAAPVDALAIAKQQFDDLVAKARAGDQAAAAKLPQFAQTFLDQSRAFNASGSGYVSDLKYVQDIIAQLGSQFDGQADLQQKQLDALAAQKQTLDDQLDELKASVAVAQEGFKQVVAGQAELLAAINTNTSETKRALAGLGAMRVA